MTKAVPGKTPVKVTVQLPDVKGQLAPTVPTAVFDDMKVTEPVGVLAAFVVSVTVALQLEVPPMLMLAGAQETLVDVLSIFPTLAVTIVSGTAAAVVPDMVTQKFGLLEEAH